MPEIEGLPTPTEAIGEKQEPQLQTESTSGSETVVSPIPDETGQAQRKGLLTTFTSLLKGAAGTIGGFTKHTAKDTAANIASGKGPETLNPLGHPAGIIRQEPPPTNQTQSSEPSQS